MKKKRIVCFGPGPKFKGGLSDFNSSLAKAFDELGHDVHIVSWVQQYPAIIPREFIDKKSRSHLLDNSSVKVSYVTNYNNPITWQKTVTAISNLKPNTVIFQWAIALQGLPLGYIVKQLKRKLPRAKIIFDLHFVTQKEHTELDKRFTKFALKHIDYFVVHAKKTYIELNKLLPEKDFLLMNGATQKMLSTVQVLQLYHPVYDLFEQQDNFDVEAFKKELGLRKHVFLFFGFIRKYKGLHNCIKSFAELLKQNDDVSLLICGEEFWNTLDDSKASTKIKSFLFNKLKKIFLKNKENEGRYRPLDMIDKLGIREHTAVINRFVPNEDVHKYFQASDAVLLFYEYATPSGIESLSYNFQKPVLTTPVGHFPDSIKQGINGYMATKNTIKGMVDVMEKLLQMPVSSQTIKHYSEQLTWNNYAAAIMKF